MMKFVRTMYYDSIANVSLLHVNVSNNQWHTLSFQLKDGYIAIYDLIYNKVVIKPRRKMVILLIHAII